MRWARCFFVLLFCWGAVSLSAQTGTEAPSEDGASVAVRLGESAIRLHGPWRFQTGDDPRWAQPGYNDAGWETVDLGGDASEDSGDSNQVAGWTAQGHPGYAGFAWYRLRVNVEGPRTALELKMPGAVDDAYQVFVNGQKIGQFGDFSHHGVRAYAAIPEGFAFPPELRGGPMVIAIRVWMDATTRFIAPDAGGLRAPPVLGLKPTVAGQVRLAWDDHTHLVGSGLLEALVLLLTLVVALTHFALARHEKAYLWLALVVCVILLANVILQTINFTTLLPQTPAILLRDALLAPMRIALWILFWASWLGLGTPKRLWHFTTELTLLLAIATAMLRPPLHGQFVSMHADRVLVPATLWLKLGLAAILFAVAIMGIRRDRTEGLPALPVVLLAVVASYQHELRLLHIPVTFLVFGFQISLGQVSTVLSLILVTCMGARRFLLAQRRKVQWELEVHQARELQQVIVPSSLPDIPGFRIDSDYRPSREVGGDFFQIIPNRKDGSVLVLVGDVTGKGLRAGMLVALIVGAVDAAAQDNPDPEHLLMTLNNRLCERGYATATCLALHITANGLATLVNAGHLPPYLNGRELEMEGALPLGTLPGLDYTMTKLQLQRGDSLVLMTDGVVEATDDDGKLLGFERIGAMIAGNATVHEVADAAAQFGQEDDILVLRVERTVAASVFTPAAA